MPCQWIVGLIRRVGCKGTHAKSSYVFCTYNTCIVFVYIYALTSYYAEATLFWGLEVAYCIYVDLVCDDL